MAHNALPNHLLATRNATPLPTEILEARKSNAMKMYPDDWRVRVTTALAVAACMAAALMLGPELDTKEFWPGGLTIIGAIIVGIVLGQLVGRLLFRPSSNRPPK